MSPFSQECKRDYGEGRAKVTKPGRTAIVYSYSGIEKLLYFLPLVYYPRANRVLAHKTHELFRGM